MSETAAEKPAFRDAIKRHRCLIPADGFFEWKKIGPKEKQPYNFGLATGSLFAFAGLWDRWRDPSNNILETCSILTTRPNSLVADIHDRMPAILRVEDYERWPDPGIIDPKAVLDCLHPFDAGLSCRQARLVLGDVEIGFVERQWLDQVCMTLEDFPYTF
jgi:putative SOS response-associated peptidase YedK